MGEFPWITDETREFLAGGYLSPGETPESRLEDIANTSSDIFLEMGATHLQAELFRHELLHSLRNNHFSLSSPIWSNFGKARGLPISCFGSHVDDTLDSILQTSHEIGMMSKFGGGTAAFFGDVRGRGAPITDNGYSEGAVHFMRLYDTVQQVSRQGQTRRGATAVYLPVDHPDIMEFLDIRDDGNPIQQLSPAVTVPEGWMQSMLNGDKDKRRVWARVLERRSESGMPYIFFDDNANDKTSPYFDSKYKVRHSQLCSEIMLPTSTDESFVCCLASMNVATYDSWAESTAVGTLTIFLDTVIEEFLRKIEDDPERYRGLERARRFAENHRAIGIGQFGYHTYLQERGIPFGSLRATGITRTISREIQRESYKMSESLGDMLGRPPVAEELGLARRNVTTTAIAPTTSSAFIHGQVSQSIEPIRSNYYIRGLAKSTTVYKNPVLKQVLAEKYDADNDTVWDSILIHDGSVQHLDFMDEHDKEVFKTFAEISQLDVIVQASVRQQFIDQGQSLNLMIHPDTPAKDIHELHVEAWKRGIKSLYYQHSYSAAQEYNRDLMNCTSCQG